MATVSFQLIECRLQLDKDPWYFFYSQDLKLVHLTIYMIPYYLKNLKDVLTLTSCTPLDTSTLNLDLKIDTIHFIWNGEYLIPLQLAIQISLLCMPCSFPWNALLIHIVNFILWCDNLKGVLQADYRRNCA